MFCVPFFSTPVTRHVAFYNSNVDFGVYFWWQGENSSTNLMAVKYSDQRLQTGDLCSVALFVVLGFRHFPAVLI